MTMLPAIPAIGAVVYPHDHPPEDLLADFTAALAARGFRLGGLLQRTGVDADGAKVMELIELDTKVRRALNQDLGSGSQSCSLDLSAMADAAMAIRRGIESRVDLLLVNKYSKVELAGGGFTAELLAAMVEGVPVLTAVPAAYVQEWIAFTGGRGDLIMPDARALWRWWGPHHVYDDLALAVPDVPAGRVVVGLNWTLVEGPHGIGLAQTPERGTGGCRSLPKLPRSLRDLAALARSWDPFEVAVGIAAINAHFNRFDLAAEDTNGLDALTDPGRTVVVGGFPGLAERLPGAAVIERDPGPGQYPEEACTWLLPAAESVVVTSSTLVNRTLPRLLKLARDARIVLVGPGCPLAPRLFDYGIGVLAGLVATDAEGLVACVAAGGGPRDIKQYCRQAAIRRPE